MGRWVGKQRIEPVNVSYFGVGFQVGFLGMEYYPFMCRLLGTSPYPLPADTFESMFFLFDCLVGYVSCSLEGFISFFPLRLSQRIPLLPTNQDFITQTSFLHLKVGTLSAPTLKTRHGTGPVFSKTDDSQEASFAREKRRSVRFFVVNFFDGFSHISAVHGTGIFTY